MADLDEAEIIASESGASESGASEEPSAASSAPSPAARQLWGELRFVVLSVGGATLAAWALRPHLAATNLAMVYLLAVVAVSTRCRRSAAILASLLSVAFFDFFCVPPYYTFRVSDYEYLITFAVMLVVALVISEQTGRIRAQTAHAEERESRTQALYLLSRSLATETRVFDAALAAARIAEQVFGTAVAIFLPDGERISFRKRTSAQLPVTSEEEPVAQWVFDHGSPAGHGTNHHPEAAGTYHPLKGTRKMVGVMCVLPRVREGVPENRAREIALSPKQQHLLGLFADQTALAMERILSQNAAEVARIQMHTEEMRSSLLSTVSHDLRTPLATITGAASTLRAEGERLPPEVRNDLLDSIFDEGERMSRLVRNLLDMTRLESGVKLRRDLYPLEEIVGAALQRIEPLLGRRQVITNLPESLPLVYVDDVLMGLVLMNLLENAVKYTPEGAPIEIEAEAGTHGVDLRVMDRGPGFAPGDERRIFEKFFRANKQGARGVGLGLAICKAIVGAHRGSIEAENRPGGGAIFHIRLALGESTTVRANGMEPS